MITVRGIRAEDEAAWRRLWRGYLDFYETDLPEAVYATSFARLTDPEVRDYHGLLALADGEPVGLAHYIFHRHGWQIEDVCYLQDLYVAPEARGTGAGRRLIEAVYAAADAAGRPRRLLVDPDLQRHRAKALRPARHRHAVHQVSPLRAMRGALLACLALAGLAACAAMPPPPEITSVRFAAVTLPRGVARSNLDLAQDFLDLTFALESGETLDHLLRYEGPVRIYLASPALAAYQPDLAELIHRLRSEAGIDIAETGDPEAAQIRLQMVPSEQISRIFPTAACFIVPGETDWQSFLRRSASARLRWPDQATLGKAAIFLPLDTTPQDVRDCLAEEITQALGPANDLYRLPDSIWNDDNFHGMATPFDMLMLRVLYQPELRSGMTREEVAKALPGILDRVNPKGRGLPPQPRQPEVEGLGLGDRGGAVARRAALEAGRRGDARHPDRRRDAPGRPSPGRVALDARASQPAPRPRGGDGGVHQGVPTLHGRVRPRRRAHRPGRGASRGAGARHRAVPARRQAGGPARPGGAQRAERHPSRRAALDQVGGAGGLGRHRGGAGHPPRQLALGALWLRRHRRGARPRAGAARRAPPPREAVRGPC